MLKKKVFVFTVCKTQGGTCNHHYRKYNCKHHTSLCNANTSSPAPSTGHTQSTEVESKQVTTVITTILASIDPQISVLLNRSNSVCLLKIAVARVSTDKLKGCATVLLMMGLNAPLYFSNTS